MSATYDVRDQRELSLALSRASAGDTIRFASGAPYRPFVLKTDGVILEGGGASISADGVPYGILVRASNTSVTGFEVSGSEGSGISVQRCDHVYVGSNDCHDNAKVGIYTQRCDLLTVAYNHAHHNGGPERGAGISIHICEERAGPETWARVKVVGNQVWANLTGGRTEGWGIILDGKYAGTTAYCQYPHKVYVAENTIEGNHAAGILAFGYRDVVIARNRVFGNSQGRASGEIVLRDTDAAALQMNATNVTVAGAMDYRINHTKAMNLQWALDVPADGIDIAIVGHAQTLPGGELGVGTYLNYQGTKA